MRRFFAGIELDAVTRDACAAISAQLRATGFDAAYQRSETFHVTLAFIGNVDEARITQIESALGDAAALSYQFELYLDRIGAFPHERAPSVVFAGAHDQGEGYRHAARTVRAAYEALGFSFEDDAVAHVTIARVKSKGPRRPAPRVDFPPVRLPVAELALFESIFDPQARTTRYEVRLRRPLQAQARAPGDRT